MPSSVPDPPTAAPSDNRHNRRWLAPAVLTLLALLYLATVLPSLGNDPIAGGDEGWIMSSAARLAREGVFGSDLFAGFYNAEHHYFFNLPLHHVIVAGAFKLGGVSLTTARMVSVLAGLAALLLTWALGKRIGGPATGLIAATLLVLLRLNLTPFSGLTLTDLGATVRYDLITLPFSLGAVLLLLRRPKSPQLSHVALSGLLIGVAALTQFIGAFVAVPLGLFLLTGYRQWPDRLRSLLLFGAMILLPFLPYFGYIAAHWDDFQGQARAVDQSTHFFSPSFYLEQILNEPDRYASSTGLESVPQSIGELLERPSARLVMLILAPAALIHTFLRGRYDRQRLLMGLLVASLAVELALFESTKRFVYWVVLVPYLCICLADLAVSGWMTAVRHRQRLLLQGAIVAAAALILLEGLAVAGQDIRNARNAPSYAALTHDLTAALPADAVVIGDNRLWPALDDGRLRSLLLLFYHTNPVISEERATTIDGAFERIGADYLLLSPLGRDILTRLSPEDTAAFERYLTEHGERVTVLENRAYGPIEVYRLSR